MVLRKKKIIKNRLVHLGSFHLQENKIYLKLGVIAEYFCFPHSMLFFFIFI